MNKFPDGNYYGTNFIIYRNLVTNSMQMRGKLVLEDDVIILGPLRKITVIRFWTLFKKYDLYF